MNANGPDGQPCISIEMGLPAGAAYFVVSECGIRATERGGIEVKPLPTGEGDASFEVVIRDCRVAVEDSETAEFGIRVGGDTGEEDGASWNSNVYVENTTIDSSDVTTPGVHGIVTGIDFPIYARDGNLMRVQADSRISGCEVTGCSGDGIRLWVDSDEEPGSATNVTIAVARNYVHDNGNNSIADGSSGAGVRLRHGTTGDPIGGLGYLHVSFGGNMIVDNDFGVIMEGFDPASTGEKEYVNDTIAGNVGPAFLFDGTFGSGPSYLPSPLYMHNLIVWGNNGGNNQHYGSGWTPGTYTPVTYSCWMGYGSGYCGSPDANNNVNSDPYFVNAGAGNYHIAPNGSACVVDKAYTLAPGMPSLDIDGENRFIDGLQDGGRQPDMGADEHKP